MYIFRHREDAPINLQVIFTDASSVSPEQGYILLSYHGIFWFAMKKSHCWLAEGIIGTYGFLLDGAVLAPVDTIASPYKPVSSKHYLPSS